MKDLLYALATDRKRGLCFAPVKFLLLLLSFLYGIIIRLMMFFSSFDRKRFNARVISVGNITIGGTGKTSLVEFIARRFKERGNKIAIITRGYKRRSFDSLGDEPSMLLKKLIDIPVIVDKDRVSAIKRAEKEYKSDIVILDDGMQQWWIKKDLEIVTIDAVNPFGNRHMIPRGILRQPLRTLSKADIFILTKTDMAGNLEFLKRSLDKHNHKALIVESVHHPVGFYHLGEKESIIDKGFIKGKKVALLSGIGDPDSFFRIISKLGAKVESELKFRDHHNYTKAELQIVSERLKSEGLKTLIITEKDAARLSKEDADIFEWLDLLVLRIELRISKNEEEFFSRLFRLYSL